MRFVCQQTILVKYHTLFVIFEKAAKYENRRLLQIIGGAFRVKVGQHSDGTTVLHQTTLTVLLIEEPKHVKKKMLGNFYDLFLSSAEFLGKSTYFENFFQEHSVKQFGSRSGPTLSWS